MRWFPLATIWKNKTKKNNSESWKVPQLFQPKQTSEMSQQKTLTDNHLGLCLLEEAFVLSHQMLFHFWRCKSTEVKWEIRAEAEVWAEGLLTSSHLSWGVSTRNWISKEEKLETSSGSPFSGLLYIPPRLQRGAARKPWHCFLFVVISCPVSPCRVIKTKPQRLWQSGRMASANAGFKVLWRG